MSRTEVGSKQDFWIELIVFDSEFFLIPHSGPRRHVTRLTSAHETARVKLFGKSDLGKSLKSTTNTFTMASSELSIVSAFVEGSPPGEVSTYSCRVRNHADISLAFRCSSRYTRVWPPNDQRPPDCVPQISSLSHRTSSLNSAPLSRNTTRNSLLQQSYPVVANKSVLTAWNTLNMRSHNHFTGHCQLPQFSRRWAVLRRGELFELRIRSHNTGRCCNLPEYCASV